MTTKKTRADFEEEAKQQREKINQQIDLFDFCKLDVDKDGKVVGALGLEINDFNVGELRKICSSLKVTQTRGKTKR